MHDAPWLLQLRRGIEQRRVNGGGEIGVVGKRQLCRNRQQQAPRGGEFLVARLTIALRHPLRGVETQRDHVVGAAEERHQVGPYRGGAGELLVPDAARGPAAHGQVGIEQGRRLRSRDSPRQATGPAAVAAVSVGIVEPFS